MPDCGRFRIGVDSSDPNTPPLLIVNVPPRISSGESLPSRARAASSASADSISAKLLRSQSRITGTTSPVGAETAMPRS